MNKETQTMTPVQFTCENCGRDVPWMDAGLHHYEHRNHCPHCLWSKHILFGTARLHPCDGLMRPDTNPLFITQECPCGFRWVTYNEDFWAKLDPDNQTALINVAWTETEKRNETPTAIYIVQPEYRTIPPPIPDDQLTTRKRAERRP